MPAAKLRAVSPGEVAPKREPMSLVEAVEAGDYLEILRAQRRDIAAALPEEKGPAKAALHRQLSIIAKEIELIELSAAADSHETEKRVEVVDARFDSAAI